MNPNSEIYNYSDYRVFLQEYYKSRKLQLQKFTFRLFAELTGFSSSSFLKLVIDGKKNLSGSSISKIIKGIKLQKKAADYFTNLVLFNQSDSIEKKAFYLEKINSFRKRNKPDKIIPDEYDYLKKWYHCIIREMVDLVGFREDPEWISDRLACGIKPDEVKRSLRFLEKNGFLYRDKSGNLKKKAKTLSTGDIGEKEALNTIARAFHRQMIRNADKALAEISKSQRDISNTTLSLSKKSYEIAVKRIDQMNMELMDIASADKEVDRIYQLNVNLFPLTKENGPDEQD